MQYQLNKENEGDQIVGRLCLTGEAVIGKVDFLMEALRQGIDSCDYLVLDCAGIGDMDCSAMQLLCSAHRGAADVGKSLQVERLRDDLSAKVLRQAGFLRHESCSLVSPGSSCLWCRRLPDAGICGGTWDTDLEGGVEKISARESAGQPGSSRQEGDEFYSTYRIRFRPEPGIFRRGVNPVDFICQLERLGSIQVIAHTEKIPGIDDIDPEHCFLYWDLVLNTCAGEETIRKFLPAVGGDSQVHIERIDIGGVLRNGDNYKRLAEILVERGDLSPEALKDILGKRKLIGEILVEAGLVQPSQVTSAVAEQQAVKMQIRQHLRRETAVRSANVNIPVEQLDELIEVVVELVQVQSSLSISSAQNKDLHFLAIGGEVERLTARLWNIALNISSPADENRSR